MSTVRTQDVSGGLSTSSKRLRAGVPLRDLDLRVRNGKRWVGGASRAGDVKAFLGDGVLEDAGLRKRRKLSWKW